MGVQQDYTTKALNLHNEYRARHNAPPLQWSHELRKVALDYAIYLAGSRNTSGQLVPKPNISWGQNLYQVEDVEFDGKTKSELETEAVERAIDSWYSDVEDYNWNFPGLSGLSFSQIVWRSTSKVGIGVAMSGGRIVIVAFYDGPGNLRGDFSNNVLPEIKAKKTAGGSSRSTPTKSSWVN